MNYKLNNLIHFNPTRVLVTFLVSVLVALLQPQPVHAFEPEFGSLTMANGLSHYSVMAIYQDERGLLWIGTRGGLDVYDGTNIKSHHRIPGDNSSPMNNYVKAITGDNAGHVYVLNIRGISIYDAAADSFTNVDVKQASAIACGNGMLYYASGNNVFSLTPDGRTQKLNILDSAADITVIQAKDSLLYIGTDGGGLFKYDIKSGQKEQVMGRGYITCVYADDIDNLWVGTQNEGLYKIDANGNRTQFRHRKDDSNSVCSDFIRCVCRDSHGRLWVGTFEGLSLYSGNGQQFTNYLTGSGSHNAGKVSRHNPSSVWALICDRQGTLWIGTYFNGLLSYNPDNDIFLRYQVDSQDGRALSHPVTGEFAEDDTGRLWISTEGGGLNSLSPSSGKIDWHIDTGNNNIKALKYDPDRQCLWVGTHLGGLKRYDIATGRYSVYPLTNDKANIVCDIEIYDHDTLLLATHDGIYSFRISDESFTHLFNTEKDGYVISLALDLALDHARTLWIGGAEGGLYNYNFITRRMNRYRHEDNSPASLGSDGINFIYVSPANDVWIGTSEAGLEKFDRERNQFIHHTHSDGILPSDCVFGARQLPDGRMLVLTDKALTIMDAESSTSYGIDDAVPLSAFNNKAIHLSADGQRAYTGGIDGMVSFAPDKLKPRETHYSVFPSRLFVDGREISVGDQWGILDESISVAKSLTLPGNHDYITLYYAITDFTHDNNLRPQYRLEGYSEDWQPLGPDNGVSFTNLAPGDYRLHVRASDMTGAPENVLEINILPPFYRQPFMIMAYVLVILVAGWWSIRAYRRRIAMRQTLALERERNRNIEELNQNKVRFFINISNEFRTPLALIIGKIEYLMRSPQLPNSLLNKVNGAYTNCILMRDMMAELLDFRRYEQGAMNVRVGEHNIVKFLAEIHALFRDYAADKGIRFRFNRSNETLMLWFDPAQLRKVINNLLSNAFKHTEANGEVTLSVRRGDNAVIIEVSDTGCGIRPEDIDKIFNRFYQGNYDVNDDWQGIGVGLALSKGIVELHHGKIEVYSTPGESSTFVVTIPIGRSHFTDEEIAESGDYRRALQYIEQHPRAVHDEEQLADNNPDAVALPEDAMVIAEGNRQLRDMLVDIFKPNFRIFSTGDGDEAMKMINENDPRLIVSGYSLPGIPGVKLCRKVKTQSSTTDIPYIFVSSHNADQEILEALNAGADDYITLPFDVRQLLARCRNIMSRQSKSISSNTGKSTISNPESIMATKGADIEFMQRAVKVIEDNMSDSTFNISRFADAMNVSRTSLFQRLKSISGQTPNDFINSIKMKHAAKMLMEQTNANVADISYALGFSSPRYFSRCFKEYYLQSPRTYRSAHKAAE